MTATHERAAAPSKETAAHIFKNSPETTESNERFNQKISLVRRWGTVRAGELVPLILANFMLAIGKGGKAP